MFAGPPQIYPGVRHRSEATELFATAGVGLPDAAVTLLHERTEGWAAELRLAAPSLAGHPDPQGFAAQFLRQ